MKVMAMSDMHIGTTANYTKLSRFLDLVEISKPDVLVGVGDNFELVWEESLNHILQWQPAAKVVSKMQRIATYIPIMLIPGNHDWFLKTYQAQLYPIRVVDAQMQFDNIIYMHGDQFDPTVRWWWNPLQKIFKTFLPSLYTHIWGTPYELKSAGKDKDYRALVGAVESAYQVWLNGRSGVFGHTHSEFLKYRRSQWIANTGDMFDSCSYLTITDGKPEIGWV